MHTYDCTFHGLHKWHEHMFQHLGWMIMAKEHKSGLKIKAYMDSIQRFLSCAAKKIENTRDEDRKNDLAILMKNMMCLQECAARLMTIPVGEHLHKYNFTNKGHEATNCGLQRWMVAKYEKLGWMCLAKQHGNMLKIEAYLESLRCLMASLEKKMKEVEEKDRKDDLAITLNNTKLLKHNAWMLLLGDKCDKTMKSNIMKTKTMKSNTSSSKSKKSKKTKKSTSWF
jgi:hypothetical protein